MTWLTIGLLAGGAYAFKWFGLEVLGGHSTATPRSAPKDSGLEGAARLGLQRIVDLLPPAMFAALIVLQTFNRTDDIRTTLTRLVGVVVGALAAWRKAPLLVVIVLAAATTAAARALT